MEMPSKQEAFDAMASMPAWYLAMYHDFESIAKKHMSDIKSKGLTDPYYDDIGELSRKYGLNFVHPKYVDGLRLATTPTKTTPTRSLH